MFNRCSAYLIAVFFLSIHCTVAVAGSIYDVPTTWVDDQNQQVTLADWKGSPVFITMAYSTCRKTCFLSLKKLEEFQAVMDEKKQSVEIIIVSYDPKNDTPKTWSAYRKQHGINRKNWHFLTGNEVSTKRLSRMLGLADYWSYDGHILHDFKISIVDGLGNITKQVDWHDLNSSNLL